jgi:DNA polymerase IV (DinB-like DNA polymerase)
MDRIIMLIDLDAFYASLEELRRPEIGGKPVVVCVYSGRTEDSGAVATSNYLARELGIRAGMPIAFAKRAAKGKDVVFLPVDKEYYGAVSDRIMDIFEDYADRFQQVSIDEAYLDVSERAGGSYEKAERIAREIKERVREEEGVSCTVGIGPNKFVAKMASKKNKPDGLTVVRPDDVPALLNGLPVGKLHGIGEKTAEELMGLGIKTVGDLASFSLPGLEERFGKNKAKLLHERALGIDDSPVEQKERQQLSRIATLKEDSSDADEIMRRLSNLCADLRKKTEKLGASFRTVTLITIDAHLKMQTRSETIQEKDDPCAALNNVRALLVGFLKDENHKKIRRVGIAVSNLSYKGKKKEQKTLFDY